MSALFTRENFGSWQGRMQQHKQFLHEKLSAALNTDIATTAESFTCFKYTSAALLRSPRPGYSKPAIPSQTGSRRQARAVGFSRTVRPGNSQIAWPQNPPLADCLADCFGVLADWAHPMGSFWLAKRASDRLALADRLLQDVRKGCRTRSRKASQASSSLP